MDIKNLEKSMHYCKVLKAIEEEIDFINKYAQKLISGDSRSSLKLSFRETVTDDEPKPRVNYEDIMQDHMREMFARFHGGGFIPKSRSGEKIEVPELIYDPLPEVLGLQIIGVVIAYKNAQKKYLQQQLKELGVTI